MFRNPGEWESWRYTHIPPWAVSFFSAAKNADLEKSIFKRLSAAYIYHFIAVELCRLASCLLSTASKVSYLARMCGSVCQSQLCPKCSTDKNICSQLTDPQDTGGTGFQDKYPKQWHVLFSVHNDMPRQMEYGPNYMKHKANLTLVMHCLSSTPAKPVRKIWDAGGHLFVLPKKPRIFTALSEWG